MARHLVIVLRLALLACCLLPVIARAQLQVELRGYIETIGASRDPGGAVPAIGGHILQSPVEVRSFYIANNHTPVWAPGGVLAGELANLVAAIRDSDSHGLNTARYHLDPLEASLRSNARGSLAGEVLATDALITQLQHRSSGVVVPRRLNPDWHLLPPGVDSVGLALAIAAGDDALDRSLAGAWPRHEEYRALVAERARILALDEIESAQVPPGPLLKPGQAGPRVELLKDRLLGPGAHSEMFDAELEIAVKAFQRAAGLEPDGMVGNATLEVMNANRFSWIDRIDANLERWRWLPDAMPRDLLRINIAAFHLRAIQNGEDSLGMELIVGRPFRQTPVFTESMKYMVLNPFWNVPFKLATEDKLPLLKTDAAKLAEAGYEVRLQDSDKFIPVTEADWAPVTRKNFTMLLRQRPGPGNAMGRIKFMLPNEFSIYLHDTNDRALFSKTERSFSSGCIRVSEPVALAQWLLRNDGRENEADTVQALIDSGATRTIYLKTPLPVYIVYFTAFVDAKGDVVFRRDIYQRDAAIVAALREED